MSQTTIRGPRNEGVVVGNEISALEPEPKGAVRLATDDSHKDVPVTREQLLERAKAIGGKDPALAALLESEVALQTGKERLAELADGAGEVRRGRIQQLEKRANLDAVTAYSIVVDAAQRGNAKEAQILHRARVFEISWEDHSSIVDDAIYYVESAGMTPGAYLERAWTTHSRMPFEAVFLAVRKPMVYAEEGAGRERVLLGWLCTENETIFYNLRTNDGMISSYLVFRSPDGRVRNFEGALVGESGAEEFPHLMTVPRIVFGLIELEASVVRETGVYPKRRAQIRSLFDRSSVPAVPVPRAYRQIEVKGRVRYVSALRKAITSCGPSWKLVHRIDVRGHWWVRVRRGEGPIPQELREGLDCKYVWVDDTTGPLDDDLLVLLRKRHIPDRKPGEWMGVLSRWVDEYERGPEDGPYIPAVWKIKVDEPLL